MMNKPIRHKLLKAIFLNLFFHSHLLVPKLSQFFQGFSQELNFNTSMHVIAHRYKHIGEEIVWQRFTWQIS